MATEELTALITRLRGPHDGTHAYDDGVDRWSAADAIEAFMQQRKVLTFYADLKSYQSYVGIGQLTPAVMMDQGKQARASLKQGRVPKPVHKVAKKGKR